MFHERTIIARSGLMPVSLDVGGQVIIPGGARLNGCFAEHVADILKEARTNHEGWNTWWVQIVHNHRRSYFRRFRGLFLHCSSLPKFFRSKFARYTCQSSHYTLGIFPIQPPQIRSLPLLRLTVRATSVLSRDAGLHSLMFLTTRWTLLSVA
jgi:hypothetical protein